MTANKIIQILPAPSGCKKMFKDAESGDYYYNNVQFIVFLDDELRKDGNVTGLLIHPITDLDIQEGFVNFNDTESKEYIGIAFENKEK